jgi:acetyl esterase/lipase
MRIFLPLWGLFAPIFFVGIFTQLSAQTSINGCGQRYKQKVFNSIQIYRDVVYSKNAPKLLTASLGIETTYGRDLVMDVFMPPPTDTVTYRPAVILAHGGGFVDIAFMGGTVLVGTMENEDVQALADTLAHWGFVAACIEYRTGFDVLSSTSIMRAVWRGSQDISAGVRFFRKNHQWFGINPNQVFIGGSSAGAFACLHSTFIDGNERIPESYEQTPILMTDLGEMHSRPIEQLTGFNPFISNTVLGNDVDSIAKGIASYWGAIGDTAWLAGQNKAPVIMFHGDNDLVVDAECAQPFSGLILVAPTTCGSIKMDTPMTRNGILHETYIEPGQGHEYWGVTNGDWGASGPNAFWLPMIQQTTNFFYKLIQPATPNIVGALGAAPNSIHTYAIQNPSPNTKYCWQATNGTIININNRTDSVRVIWANANVIGQIKAQALDRAEVASLQRSVNIYVNSSVVSVEESNSQPFSVRAYPNPTQHSLFVELQTSSQSAPLEMSLWDMLGRCVYTQKINNPHAEQLLELPVSDFPVGTYLLQTTQAGHRQQLKFGIYR